MLSPSGGVYRALHRRALKKGFRFNAFESGVYYSGRWAYLYILVPAGPKRKSVRVLPIEPEDMAHYAGGADREKYLQLSETREDVPAGGEIVEEVALTA